MPSSNQKNDKTRMLLYDLRAYYTMGVIAAACGTTQKVLLDVINGKELPQETWDKVSAGVNKLSKEKRQ